MTFAVLPTMARLFQEHDGARDPSLTCRSCHGADAERVAYRMPHGLPPLPADWRGKVDARTAEFMEQRVTPAMADLLGKESYGCFGCHPRGER